jgi:hypothetical protein
MDISFANREIRSCVAYNSFFQSTWSRDRTGERAYDNDHNDGPFKSRIISLQLYKDDIIKIQKGEKRAQIITGKIFWWNAKELRGGMTIETFECYCKDYKKNNECKHQTQKTKIWFDMWDIVEMLNPSTSHELVDALPFKGSNVHLISDPKIRGKVFWRGIGKGGTPSVGFKSNGESVFIAGEMVALSGYTRTGRDENSRCIQSGQYITDLQAMNQYTKDQSPKYWTCR